MNTTSRDHKILTTRGFSEAESIALQAILALSESALQVPWEYSAQDECADAVLVSLDSEPGNRWWADHRASSSGRLVACSRSTQTDTSWGLVMGPKLPPSRRAFVHLLNRISENPDKDATEEESFRSPTHTEPGAASANGPSNRPQKSATTPSEQSSRAGKSPAALPQKAIRDFKASGMVVQVSPDLDKGFDPDLHLTGVIETAIREKKNFELEAGGIVVLVSPGLDRYFIAGGLDEIAPLCHLEPEAMRRHRPLTMKDLLKLVARLKLKSRPLDELRWFAALIGSDGRLWKDWQRVPQNCYA